MADLRCGACNKYLGDNNDLITSGPHMGARPTDLTVYCDVTGKQEAVVDLQIPIAKGGIAHSWWAKLMRGAQGPHGKSPK